MNYVVIGCRVFYREISYLVAKTKNKVDVVWLAQGLHDTPELLNSSLKEEINKIENRENKPDAILLAYGLCSNGIVGLRAETIPIIVPKTDDCIGIFLGSQERYLEYFSKYSGAYWYNPGWVENAFTPSGPSLAKKKAELIEQYGEENGEYIFSVTNNYVDKYKYGIYIKSSVYDQDDFKDYTKQAAIDLGWEYQEVEDDLRMLKKLVDGAFDYDFLVCNPGYKTVLSEGENKIKSILDDNIVQE